MKSTKKIWRKNFEIMRTHYQMATPALQDMMDYQYVTVGRRIINEIVYVQEGINNTGSFMPREQLKQLAEETLEVIINNPKKIDAIHKKAEDYNTKYFQYAKESSQLDWNELTNEELGKKYTKMIKLSMLSHGWALPSTWFVDDDEDFSKFLLGRLQDIIKHRKSKLNLAEIFSILTTPARLSLGFQEEIDSLKITLAISNNPQAKKMFLDKNTQRIAKGINKLDEKLTKKIINHYKKWRWTPYTYMGPAYDLDYYLEIWSGIIKQKIDIEKELKRLENQTKTVRKQKQKLIKTLKINSNDRHLFEIAADIIFLKAYRKDSWFYANFIFEKLYKEIGKRLRLSLRQVWFMGWWEVVPALKKGFFDANILNDRMKYSILYMYGAKPVIYTGVKAKKFLETLNLETIELKDVDKLTGSCAYPGQAEGIVRIINVPDEISKISRGEIMVSHTTFPSLVPAMKKASAIVTDDGGITCHAAIVARELKTPCIVGTKIATKVLKDGDYVEVDANQGVIKKI